MTYIMNDQNVITSITLDGVTFDCNIQTDGTWSVYLPVINYEDGLPSDILVADLNKENDTYFPIYDTEGNVTNEYIEGDAPLENKYFFYWPKDSGFNVFHYWDSVDSSYDDRATLYGIPLGDYYTIALPFDTVGFCLCIDGKASTHTENWVVTTPGTYWYNKDTGTWSTTKV